MGFFTTLLLNFFISAVISVLLRPKPESNKNDASLNDLKFPEATEGKTIPLIVGRRHVKAPNLLWYEPTRITPAGKRDVYTEYHGSLHMAIGYSPLFLFNAHVDNKSLNLPASQIGGLVQSEQIEILGFESFANKIISIPDDGSGGIAITIDQSGQVGRGSSESFINIKKVFVPDLDPNSDSNLKFNGHIEGAIVDPRIVYTNTVGEVTVFPILIRAESFLSPDQFVNINELGGHYFFFITKEGNQVTFGVWASRQDQDGNFQTIPEGSIQKDTVTSNVPNVAQPTLMKPTQGHRSFLIRRPNLFGGAEDRGGISGRLDFIDGQNPVLPAVRNFMETNIGTPSPDYLGICSALFFDGYLGSNSPTILPWSFDVGYFPNPFNSINEHVIIDQGANPAMILYECLINKVWGAGLNPEKIDTQSFIDASVVMFEEQIGSHFIWSGSSKISEIMKNILDDIFGFWVTDANDKGLVRLQLMRPFKGDINTLPILKPLDQPISKGIAAYGDTNQVVATYSEFTPTENKDRTITVNHDAGLEAAGGQIKTKQVRMSTIGTESSARYIANLHLLTGSSPLQNYEVTVDRFDDTLRPGEFVFFEHESSITNLHRVLNIDITGRKAKIKLIEDVFSQTFYGAEFAGFNPNELYKIP